MPMMLFGVVGWVGWDDFSVEVGSPEWQGANFFFGLMYRKNVVLQCGCSIPAAE